jgi:hypothetical protein
MTEEENVESPGVLGSDPAPETAEPQVSDDGGWGSLQDPRNCN